MGAEVCFICLAVYTGVVALLGVEELVCLVGAGWRFGSGTFSVLVCGLGLVNEVDSNCDSCDC